MLISDSQRMLFVHVQKTGGVSVDRMLRAQIDDIRIVGPRHSTLGRILKTEPDLQDYWTFGFVRNPWARMVSWWSMIQNLGKSYERKTARGVEPGVVNRFLRSTAGYQDFEEFILRGMEEHRRLRRPQIDYLTAGDRRADFIGRTESFAADLRAAQERLGLPLLEPVQLNRSKHATYPTFYTDTTREKVAAAFASDIELFGYEF
jgi:hypothetical protein